MSARLLLNPHKPHELQDDLESFFFVVLFNALRYTKHNLVSAGTSKPFFFLDSFEAFFAGRVEDDGTAVGGMAKADLFLTEGQTLKNIKMIPLKFASKPLQKWYRAQLLPFGQWYRHHRQQEDPDLSEDDEDLVKEEDILLLNHGNIARDWKQVLDQAEGSNIETDAVEDQLPAFEVRVVDPIYPESGAGSDIASLASSISRLSSASTAASTGSKRKNPVGVQETPKAKRPRNSSASVSSSLGIFPPVAKLELGDETFFES